MTHHNPPWRITRLWWVPIAALAAITIAGLAGAALP